MEERGTYTSQQPEDIVFTPNDAMNLGLEELNEREQNEHSGVPLHIAAYDKVSGGPFNPMRPGELITLIGRPGHFKTGLMLHTLREEASAIMKRIRAGDKKAEKEIVIYVTWEITVEEAALLDLAAATRIDISEMAAGKLSKEQWDKIRRKAAGRSAFPLWIFGFSLKDRQARPSLSLDDVRAACEYVEQELGYKPRLIGLDYLNQMQALRRASDRRREVMDNVTASKNLGFTMGCPVMLAAQAKREVDDRKVQIPLQGDGMETSNLEHTSDKMIGVHYLKKVYDPGETVEYKGTSYVVDNSVLWTKFDKQRYGDAGMMIPLTIEPGMNRVLKSEFKKVDIQEKLDKAQEEPWQQSTMPA